MLFCLISGCSVKTLVIRSLSLKYLLFSPQTKVYGKDRVKFMESLIIGDVAELKDNQVKYTEKVQNISCLCESLMLNRGTAEIRRCQAYK